MNDNNKIITEILHCHASVLGHIYAIMEKWKKCIFTIYEAETVKHVKGTLYIIDILLEI